VPDDGSTGITGGMSAIPPEPPGMVPLGMVLPGMVLPGMVLPGMVLPGTELPPTPDVIVP